MGKPSCISDRDLLSLLETIGPAKAAKQTGLKERAIYKRRAHIERLIGRQITIPTEGVHNSTRHNVSHPHRIHVEIETGIVIVGGDCHYWPGPPSTAHRAFVKFIHEYAPQLVVLNGDVLDCATISRFPPIGWDARPTLIAEIETAQERLDEIAKASTKKIRRTWCVGNHDQRFSTRLATVAPEYARIHGVNIKDHFGAIWEPCWSTWINNNVVVTHRYKGGMHATRNNTIFSGKSIITGHLHSAKVTPFDDYNGTRYGVDHGCIAEADHTAFVDYTEDNPKDWRSGFCVLTFVNGKLLMPELVLVWDESHVQFRGRVIAV